MGLSKTFDTLNHDVLIAKLYVYSFRKESLKHLFDYLSDRWKRTKICGNFSSKTEYLQGTSKGSVDFFCLPEMTDFCNFSDDANSRKYTKKSH